MSRGKEATIIAVLQSSVLVRHFSNFKKYQSLNFSQDIRGVSNIGF